MKFIIIVFVLMFLMMSHRHARTAYVTTLFAAVVLFALVGCATEQPTAHPVRNPGTTLTCADIVAAHDGSYLFTRCTP